MPIHVRLNEFPRGQDHDDLWLFEQVQEPQTESKEMSPTEGGKHFEERLVQLLDGQMSTLESKSSTDSTKRTNVPIVMIGNNIKKCIRKRGPLQSMFIRLLFQSQLQQLQLKEEQIISRGDALNGEYVETSNLKCRIRLN